LDARKRRRRRRRTLQDEECGTTLFGDNTISYLWKETFREDSKKENEYKDHRVFWLNEQRS
jgi:hypothetical protein